MFLDLCPVLSSRSSLRGNWSLWGLYAVRLLRLMDTFDEHGLRSICSDFLTRSLSLKCFVSKFLLKLRNDALFQQHLHVSDELRRHLEENAAGECFIEVAADDVEPVQSSPPADSPIAPSCITSRSLEASQTFMTPLRYDPSQSSIGDATFGVEILSAGRISGSEAAGNSSQDFGQSAGAASRGLPQEPVVEVTSLAALASSSMQTSSVLSSATLPQFIQSLTPLGGSGSGSSKDRAIESGPKNAASSFTSQDNCIPQAPQGQVMQQQQSHQLPAPACDTIHSSHAQLLPPSSKEIDQATLLGGVLQPSDQKQLQQQQKAAVALSKYQEFLRQQHMPPPQSNQLASSDHRADVTVTMVSISQQTSQVPVFEAESPLASHQRCQKHTSGVQLPQQERSDSSKTATCDTLTPLPSANLNASHASNFQVAPLQSPPPTHVDTVPLFSSSVLSQSLSLNHHHFPASPSGVQATTSPIASRLPKVLPFGDGRAGFIVLPAAAHADAVAAAMSPAVSSATHFGKDAPNTLQSSTHVDKSTFTDNYKSPADQFIIEGEDSDAETQDSALSGEKQEETLVIPETPTGTPIQPHSTRNEDRGASAVSSRRPRPQPICLVDSADAFHRSSTTKSDVEKTGSAALISSGKVTRKAVYAKIVALPTQPAASSTISAVRMSSRGRTIRPKVKFDSTTNHHIAATESSNASHVLIEKGNCIVAVGSTNASAKRSRGKSSSVQDPEDDAPLVRPVPESRHIGLSNSVSDVIVSRNQVIHPTRAQCNETTQIPTHNSTLDFQHQNHRRHHGDNLVSFRKPASVGAESNQPILSLVLRHVNFIVTNVSSENTVDINKGQLDRTGTSKKVLVARATALGMAAWTAVANVNCSAVHASSCPLPPHLVVMCETVVSASTQMLVALAIGITPLHCSWLSSCLCADGSSALISDSFVLPLDAIIPKDYARLSIARTRHACVTPLPIERRVLSGRTLGYYAKGASVARIVTVLSFAGAVVTAVDDAVSAHSPGCEYIIVESKDEAATLGGNHVPFDWIIAVLCIGYVQPLVSSLVLTSQVQTPVAQRSSRSAIKRACAVETVLVEKPPSATKRSRASDLSPTYDGRGGVKCRSNQSVPGPLVPASINTASPRSPVSPSEQAASSHILADTKKKASFSPRHSKTGGSISASPGHAALVIPSCFRLYDLKSKACVRFDESGSVTSKVYSKTPSSNCELHAVESDQHGPYPHRLQCSHKSFLCVGRDGSVFLAGKGAGGRNLFKFAQSGCTRKAITYEIIHESGRFLSLNASGIVGTTSCNVEATKWQLQPVDGSKKTR